MLGLIAKIAWEQLIGPSSTTGELINARVAIEAHLAGALLEASWLWRYGYRIKSNPQ
ncbi:hypothetical protein [Shewanella sp. 10N.286.48.B5]|uniref:hypothetical protein n=1 Tax=Shewanella sp. 10N.286.48.B5 TaxID=1880834 RepID=UPI0039A5FDED